MTKYTIKQHIYDSVKFLLDSAIVVEYTITATIEADTPTRTISKFKGEQKNEKT